LENQIKSRKSQRLKNKEEHKEKEKIANDEKQRKRQEEKDKKQFVKVGRPAMARSEKKVHRKS